MATRDELREALDEYVRQAQANERVRRSLKGWNCVIQIETTDLPDTAFTMTITNGEPSAIAHGLQGTPDLIVRGSSEDLTNIFWCDENPASTYMQGAIQTHGSQEDVMRLDAMAMFIYLAATQANS
ncbi:MAG TPA: SCP2 sterol-binding domain-containing protein [Ktedonobacterales bacterium]